MSAEKEIVNFWLNKSGYFTISNLKASKNKDIGIIALKFNKDKIDEIQHIEVSCSISNTISEISDVKKAVEKALQVKFEDAAISKAVDKYLKQFSMGKQNVKRMFILGSMPKSKKTELIKGFKSRNIEVIEFENILFDVMKDMDTQYYKSGILRTLQLIKYLLLSNPMKMAELLDKETNILNVYTRQEFFRALLSLEEMKKEFRKTNEEEVAEILKYYSLREPLKLAELLEKDILNKRTRKPFLKALLEQEKMRKVYKEETKEAKFEKPLSKFF